MKRRHMLGAIAAATAAPSLWAQGAYPNRAIRIVTPFGPGQGPEVLLRLIAEKLQTAWGQAVVIENKPGASGFVAFETAKQAPGDGYTLVNMDSFHIGTQPHLFKKLPYDAFKDFAPITPLIRNHFFITVPSTSKWKTVADLIAAAKAKPDAVSYGSWGVASPAHFGGMLLESMAGLQMLHVPFKQPSQLYSAVATGEVDFAFGSAISTRPFLDAGKVRLLAAAAPTRIAGYTQVPTVAESGGPAGFELGGWNGLLAPASTPKDIVAKLNEGIRSVMKQPDMREKLASFTYDDYTMTAAEMAAVMQNELRQWGHVIQRANLKLD